LALLHTNKLEKGVAESLEDTTTVKHREPHMPSIDEFSALTDHSSPGVELVRFHQGQSKTASDIQPSKSTNPYSLKLESSHASLISSSHPLESTSLASSSRVASDNGFSLHTKSNNRATADGHGRERAQPLGISSERTHQALALEHLEDMWTKGKNYKSENAKLITKVSVGSASLGSTSVQQSVPCCTSICQNPSNSERQAASAQLEDQHLVRHSTAPTYPNGIPKSISAEMAEHAGPEDFGVESESSYATEDDEFNNVTGLDSPVTRVWESKSKGNATLSHIHHPLESPGFHRAKKNRSHVGKLKMSRTSSGRKRSRSNAQKPPIWQEVERSSFSVGDGMDILNTSANDSKTDELDEDPEVESMARMFSSSNASSLSLPSSDSSYASNYRGANVLQDSYLKLRCEVAFIHLIYFDSDNYWWYTSLSDFHIQVVGANIVKSGSGMFAVYSISVTDANGNNWSIKRRWACCVFSCSVGHGRYIQICFIFSIPSVFTCSLWLLLIRFRHFEELHRRLKEYAQYNLHLPPKHFLSSGLEVPVVRERCKLLDIYLKVFVVPTS
jgi:sorting nexin-13